MTRSVIPDLIWEPEYQKTGEEVVMPSLPVWVVALAVACIIGLVISVYVLIVELLRRRSRIKREKEEAAAKQKKRADKAEKELAEFKENVAKLIEELKRDSEAFKRWAKEMADIINESTGRLKKVNKRMACSSAFKDVLYGNPKGDFEEELKEVEDDEESQNSFIENYIEVYEKFFAVFKECFSTGAGLYEEGSDRDKISSDTVDIIVEDNFTSAELAELDSGTLKQHIRDLCLVGYDAAEQDQRNWEEETS